jgi:type IV pilus assembly protein PilP
MGEFVSGIAALPRIVTLHDITIKPENKDCYDYLSFELTAKTSAISTTPKSPREKARRRRRQGRGSSNDENTGKDMFSKSKNSWLLMRRLCASSAAVGCSSKDDELDQFIAETKKEPGGASNRCRSSSPTSRTRTSRSTCVRRSCRAARVARPGAASDSRRNREFLEQFSLDTLRMVGTLRLSDRTYGLIKTKDGLVHRVLPGNYLGQADGPGHRDFAFED